MDLEVFVQEARLWNHDPGPQSELLIRKLRAETPATIIDLYEQAQRRAATVYDRWSSRPEPRDLFELRAALARASDVNRIGEDPAPPLGRLPEPKPFEYEPWLRGWCLYQVLVGNFQPPEGHFREHPDRPAAIDYVEGMFGNAFPLDFQAAFERSTETLWPFVRREDAEFLVYNEDLEDAPYRVRLYRGRAREVTMDLNASAAWRQWWLSGPLRVLEFRIAGSYGWYPGAAAMHTGDSATSTRMRKTGLSVTSTIMPNLDRILATDESDIRRLVIEDLTVLLRKVHKKYGFTGDLPEAE
ncbi:hypothetical protein [Arthrobacter sp. NPDC093139]|uniref:hypothetical protein n=1 Tax=Arthrobacter sp. NPDC093139 TaxID=3363945 RepID=UPI0037F14B5C